MPPQHLVLHPSPTLDSDAISSQGWDHFKVVFGAAAGPRNLPTMGVDHHLVRATASKWLVGGSFSALRHCAVVSQASCGATQEAGSLTEQLARAFCEMVWQPGDTCETLVPMMERLYQIVAPRPADIVHHPTLRVAIMVATVQPWVQCVPSWMLHALFYTFLAANVVSGSVLQHFQRRLCFYTGPEPPPFFANDPSILCFPLMESNLHQVLHATTCIPFVSRPCTYINGIGEGLYFDGALTDYQLNCACSDPAMPALVLGIDTRNTIKANLWDTVVPWRGVKPCDLEHVSILAPTSAFQEKLPGGRFPDTYDFFKKAYVANPKLRIDAWMSAYYASVAAVPADPTALLTSPRAHTPAHPTCGVPGDDAAQVKSALQGKVCAGGARGGTARVLAVWEGMTDALRSADSNDSDRNQAAPGQVVACATGDGKTGSSTGQWGGRGGLFSTGGWWGHPGAPPGLVRWDLGRWAWRVLFSSGHWMD